MHQVVVLKVGAFHHPPEIVGFFAQEGSGAFRHAAESPSLVNCCQPGWKVVSPGTMWKASRNMTRLEKRDKKEISRRWNKCWRKKQYNQKDAEIVVFRMISQGKAKMNELYCYPCEYCEKYHVGRR